MCWLRQQIEIVPQSGTQYLFTFHFYFPFAVPFSDLIDIFSIGGSREDCK